MNSLRTHKDLLVWKKSSDLAEKIYELTEDFPEKEKFGITSQMRRAVVSISSNIAEGASRGTTSEFRKFLYYSLGSASEVETQAILAHRLGFSGKVESILEDVEEVKKLISGLIRSLREAKSAAL